MPGSGSTSWFFADCFFVLVVFLRGADFVNSFIGLKGCDWLWELMMVSQMTAWDKEDASGEG